MARDIPQNAFIVCKTQKSLVKERYEYFDQQPSQRRRGASRGGAARLRLSEQNTLTKRP
ncbi:MAG: hypothetical protein JKY71_08620 [Alphaproteobacteria bacterium]|nr:hypothetical protein [Alphaproteobacteria bacterium]